MIASDVKSIIEKVEQLLAEEELSERTELAIQELLNVVEALCADKKSLADEVERLRKQLEAKKKAKNTSNRNKEDQDTPGDDDSANSNHSSEKRRKSSNKPKANDRRSFKDLTIHDTVECPVDPDTLPPDAVRLQDEIVIVQTEVLPRIAARGLQPWRLQRESASSDRVAQILRQHERAEDRCVP